MKSTVSALAIFTAVMHDRRFDLVCNARYATHSTVAIEFCGKYIAAFDLQHDGSNAVECALHALHHSPLRSEKAFSLRINTLGKRAVYGVATMDSSNAELTDIKHVRTSKRVADALLHAWRDGVVHERSGAVYTTAYESNANYFNRLLFVRP